MLARLFCYCATVTLLLVTSISVRAQIDPYARLTDPRAIARISGNDNQPLRTRARHGLPSERDPLDSNYIIAADSGAGVITHIWMTTSAPDSLTNIKLFIDDSLIISTSFYSFFEQVDGVLRGPLDSTYPGGFVCDVQMPYRKNFKITYQGDYNIYQVVEWRPVSDPNDILHTFSLTPGAALFSSQVDAERSLRANNVPWTKEPTTVSGNDLVIPSKGSQTLLDIGGSGFIRKLQIRSRSENTSNYDSLWLMIYWDDSPYPSVNVPLADFFCEATGVVPVRSLYIKADEWRGLETTFPMPFSTHAKIVVENRSISPFPLLSFVEYKHEHVSRDTFGYFHAVFSESNPTEYHVMHPVLYEQGRGKYIGMYQAIPKIRHPVAIEGDPIMTIDSNSANFLRYTGGEDYFNGGWWFYGQLFSRAFAGHLTWFETFYRFHVLDAVDFTSSIHFDLQHGTRTDVRDHYRTIAYYYKQWTPFWTTRDTIRVGEEWSISGSGYNTGEVIKVRLDDEEILVGIADGNGMFSLQTTVPLSWKLGQRTLSVNGITRPQQMLVLGKPLLYPVSSSIPPVLRFGDSLLVRGKGFMRGEKISIYLDSIKISSSDTIIVKEDYSFEAIVSMPYIADRSYKLAAHGEVSGRTVATIPVNITRYLVMEFEDLVPSAVWEGDTLYHENLSYRYYADWSRQGVATYKPDPSGDSVRFRFHIPVSDTFTSRLLLSVGKMFGNYEYFLDDKKLGDFTGYKLLDPDWLETWPSDSIRLGTFPLASGEHTFTFRYKGSEPLSTDHQLGADALLLTPTSILPLSPGTILDSVTNVVSGVTLSTLYPYIYPNPVSTSGVVIGMTRDNLSTDSGAVCAIRIIDASGRTFYRSMVTFENFRAEEFISSDTFAAGSYFVVLTYTQGKETREFSRLLTVTK